MKKKAATNRFDAMDWSEWLGALEVARLVCSPPGWLLRFSTVTSAPVVWWWDWKIGQVSAALGELERMGVLESRWESERSAALRGRVRRRRLYRSVRACQEER